MAKIRKPQAKDAGDTEGYYEPYAEYAKTLRNWLAAYGIGGPVFFLTHDKAWEKLASSGSGGSVALLFLLGVASQVLLAFVNKVTMWVIYYGESHSSYRGSRFYRFMDWFSEQFTLDIFCDLASLLAFGYATYLVFRVFGFST